MDLVVVRHDSACAIDHEQRVPYTVLHPLFGTRRASQQISTGRCGLSQHGQGGRIALDHERHRRLRPDDGGNLVKTVAPAEIKQLAQFPLPVFWPPFFRLGDVGLDDA